MGAFYGSIQVRSENRDEVIAVVEALASERGNKYLVSPVLNGWVGIYPEGSGQDDKIGAAVAERLGGVVLHILVHDSDVMAYWLWRDHQLVDRYWSRPGYFGAKDRQDQEMMCGQPEAFRALIAHDANRLAKVLSRDAGTYLLEDERLKQFAKVLGIANALSSYEYLKEGDAAGRKGWRQFKEIPPDTTPTYAQINRENRKVANSDRRFLEKEGFLLLRDERKNLSGIPNGCSLKQGYAVAWPHGFGADSTVEFYGRPWKAAAPLGFKSSSHYLTPIATDRSRDRAAIGSGTMIRLFDVLQNVWNPLAEISDPNTITELAFSRDGAVVAYLTSNDIVAKRISDGGTILRLPGRVPPNYAHLPKIAFLPSDDGLAIVGTNLELVSLRDQRRCEKYIGGKANPQPWSHGPRPNWTVADYGLMLQRRNALFDIAIAGPQEGIKSGKDGKLTEQQIEGMRLYRNAVEAQDAPQISALKEGRILPVGAISKEHITCVGFSHGGKWIWCGTNQGLRVYRWELVPRDADSDMPEPTWKYTFALSQQYGSGIFAVVEEVDEPALMFGGGDGRVYRLLLDTGETRELARLPGSAAIHKIVMSQDGTTIGIAATWAPQTPCSGQDMRYTWDIWDYSRLRGMFDESGGAFGSRPIPIFG